MRYGGRIASADNSSHPGPDQVAPNRLERYFDSHTAGPGVEKWRHYFGIYDRHFARFVGNEVHVVEIGVSSGGSLQMWRDYFGAECHVYGIDIDPACRAHETDFIRIHIGDQSDPRFWTGVLREIPRIDILIDDGGHHVHEQRITFEAVYPHLQPGGVYLCEDIHEIDHPFLGYVAGLSRSLHAWRRYARGEHATSNCQQMIQSMHLYPYVTVIERPQVAPLALPSQRRGTEWRQVS
jgi:Methyltransferase domain